MVLKLLDIHRQKNETHLIQINSKLIIDLNMRHKAIKLQRICRPTEEFLETTPKMQSLKGKKLGKLDFVKI